MKIAQFYEDNSIRMGLIHGDGLIPVTFDGDMVDLIKCGELPGTQGKSISLDHVKWAPAVTRATKIIALGLNYKDHAQ
ncbi:MAG: hypothetical protein K8R45_02705 [Desulfobacterales bacterium]|nr:hypothetical protein [Desulfobacterales bacterium]